MTQTKETNTASRIEFQIASIENIGFRSPRKFKSTFSGKHLGNSARFPPLETTCGQNVSGHISRPACRTGGSSIKKTYKGHSQDPPTLVVKWMETLSRDVTWLRSDAFLKNHRSPDNLKRNCSKFSEATLFVSIPPYPCCNPALPVAAGARGDGVAKQIDLGPRWDPRPPPERSVACRHRAALRVEPE